MGHVINRQTWACTWQLFVLKKGGFSISMENYFSFVTFIIIQHFIQISSIMDLFNVCLCCWLLRFQEPITGVTVRNTYAKVVWSALFMHHLAWSLKRINKEKEENFAFLIRINFNLKPIFPFCSCGCSYFNFLPVIQHWMLVQRCGSIVWYSFAHICGERDG